MAKKGKVVERIRLEALVTNLRSREGIASVDLYLHFDKIKPVKRCWLFPTYLTDMSVPISKLPPSLREVGAVAFCVIRGYSNGKTDYVFEVPEEDLRIRHQGRKQL